MDLSTYYEEFRTTYIIASIVICIAIATVLFIGIRSILDKKESILQKVINWILLLGILLVVGLYYFKGPFLAKKDIDEGTIHYYSGNFEITEISNGIYNKAVFLINGEKFQLKFFENDGYDYDKINIGKYDGEIVYAKHTSQILHIRTQGDGSHVLTN